jgi:hypothetical protein
MTPEEFISAAIECGAKEGVHALSGKERVVFLVSEAEVRCDMEGIDTLVDRIERKELFGVSEAFAAIGASEIAACLGGIEQALPVRDEHALARGNDLVRTRAGYSYEAIARYVSPL